MSKSNLTATIKVEWGDESHSLTLTPRNWAAIKAGRAHSQRGAGYLYEGEFFWDYWKFLGGPDPELEVGYGINEDSGVGWEGNLSGADVVEHEYKGTKRKGRYAGWTPIE